MMRTPLSYLAMLAGTFVLTAAVCSCSKEGQDQPAVSKDKSSVASDAKQKAIVKRSVAETIKLDAHLDQMSSLPVEELRAKAREALKNQKIYAPAGDNAVEYNIALRERTVADALEEKLLDKNGQPVKPKPDIMAESTLIDLMPYVVIAAEQAILADNAEEAERLRLLISRADPQAPSLDRIKNAIAGMGVAKTQRLAQEEQARLKELADKTLADKQKSDTELLAKEKAAKEKSDAIARAQALSAQPSILPPSPSQPQKDMAATRKVPSPPAVPTPSNATPRIPAKNTEDAPSSSLVAISNPQPQYPAAAQRSGTAGEVTVTFVVNTDGRVGDVSVVSSKPRGVFDRTVVAAVKRWTFKPVSSPQTVTRRFDFSPRS